MMKKKPPTHSTLNMQSGKNTSQTAIESYKKAVALKYDGKTAPQVTATGTGDIAEDIIALAREFDIPLYENPELTEMLSMLELGDQIPHELYIIIAQIIALAYKVKGEIPSGIKP